MPGVGVMSHAVKAAWKTSSAAPPGACYRRQEADPQQDDLRAENRVARRCAPDCPLLRLPAAGLHGTPGRSATAGRSDRKASRRGSPCGRARCECDPAGASRWRRRVAGGQCVGQRPYGHVFLPGPRAPRSNVALRGRWLDSRRTASVCGRRAERGLRPGLDRREALPSARICKGRVPACTA